MLQIPCDLVKKTRNVYPEFDELANPSVPYRARLSYLNTAQKKSPALSARNDRFGARTILVPIFSPVGGVRLHAARIDRQRHFFREVSVCAHPAINRILATGHNVGSVAIFAIVSTLSASHGRGTEAGSDDLRVPAVSRVTSRDTVSSVGASVLPVKAWK